MAYSRTIRVAFLCSLFLAILQLCSALPDDSTISSPASPLVPREEDDPDIATAIADYQATYACFERDDGQGPCFQEQCREACALAEDRIPKDCHNGGGSRKWRREDEESAITGSVTCKIEGKWQSADGSGEPIEGKRIRFGHCLCNDAAIAVIGDFFIDSVDKIGEIMEKFVCPAFLALDIVINAGVSAIPGVGQAITAGMKVSIQVAKAVKVAYEGMDAASAFADFMIGGAIPSLAKAAGCSVGTLSKKDLMEKVYPPLSKVPDDVVPGVNPADLPCGRGGGKKKSNGQCERENDDDGPSNAPSSPPKNTQDPPSETKASSEAPPTRTNTPSQTGSASSDTAVFPSGSGQSISPTKASTHSEHTSVTTTGSVSSSTASVCSRRSRSRRHHNTKRFLTDTPETPIQTTFATSLGFSISG